MNFKMIFFLLPTLLGAIWLSSVFIGGGTNLVYIGWELLTDFLETGSFGALFIGAIVGFFGLVLIVIPLVAWGAFLVGLVAHMREQKDK